MSVSLAKALTEDEWKDNFTHGRLTINLDDKMRVVVRDRSGRVGIGRSPAQALDDYRSNK